MATWGKEATRQRGSVATETCRHPAGWNWNSCDLPRLFLETELGHSRYSLKLRALDESSSWHLGIYCDIFIASLQYTHIYTFFIHTHTYREYPLPLPALNALRCREQSFGLHLVISCPGRLSGIFMFYCLSFVSLFFPLFPFASTVEIFEY